MSADYMVCKHILAQLREHAVFFLWPVDPIRDEGPDYREIVKEPMDLQNMARKLRDGVMISNAKQYNPAETYMYIEATNFEAYFDEEWMSNIEMMEASDRS
jgi:transcription initiation factor TFIID subunit 2